ncbi:hypothetical protein I5S86_19560 [Priestia aryabhattai]|nr:hypothetical protein I5S86_19560 [Priestia aryabhattai]
MSIDQKTCPSQEKYRYEEKFSGFWLGFAYSPIVLNGGRLMDFLFGSLAMLLARPIPQASARFIDSPGMAANASS